MRDAATRARTREKHDTKTQLKKQVNKASGTHNHRKNKKGAGHPTSGVQPLTTNPPRILGKRITCSQKVENGIISFSRLTIHTTQRPSSPTQR